MQSVSLRRRSLVDEVVDNLSQFIEQSGLDFGERLPTEAQLVKQLGVSRNALREAVRRLETVGLVQVLHGQGMYVGGRDGLAGCTKLFRSAMSMSGRNLTEAAELRCVLEQHTVRRAAELATPAQIAELRVALDRMGRNDQSIEEAVRADFEFHRKIAEVTGNQLMLSLMTILEELLLLVMSIATEKPRDFRQNQELHIPIWESLRDGDPAAAEQAMREHMRIFNLRIALATEMTKE